MQIAYEGVARIGAEPLGIVINKACLQLGRVLHSQHSLPDSRRPILVSAHLRWGFRSEVSNFLVRRDICANVRFPCCDVIGAAVSIGRLSCPVFWCFHRFSFRDLRSGCLELVVFMGGDVRVAVRSFNIP